MPDHHPLLVCFRNTVVQVFLFVVSSLLVVFYAFGTLGPNDSFLGKPLPLMHYCFQNGRAGIIGDALQDAAVLGLLLTPPVLFSRSCLKNSRLLLTITLIPIIAVQLTSWCEGIAMYLLYPLTLSYCAEPFLDAIAIPPPLHVIFWRVASQVFALTALLSIPIIVIACAVFPFFGSAKHSIW